MIRPTCDHCGDELETYGGLAFSPPMELPDGSADPNVKKKHICVACWKQFEEWLMCPANSVEAMMKICAQIVALGRTKTPNEFTILDWEPMCEQAKIAITYKGGGTFKP